MGENGTKSQRKTENGNVWKVKPNRSNKFTTGLCNTFVDSNYRTLFFEIDQKDINLHLLVHEVYMKHKLDVVYHKTGGGGMHFLSPTLMEKEQWKEIISELKGLNPECPMTTLRMQPNKYANEEGIWYLTGQSVFGKNTGINSREMCNYINHIFGTTLSGIVPTTLKIVHYPLPL